MKKPLPLSNTLHYRTAKSVSPEDLYADRDPDALGEHFMRHLDRMTVEGLHSKSDIACELAHRDTEIAALQVEVARLTACLERANSQTEEFERKWYLSCDEVETLRGERDALPSKVAELTPAAQPEPNRTVTFGGRCVKHPLQVTPCSTCIAEANLIKQGICPECEGAGEQGGQFCGGYWKCETCNGTGNALPKSEV